MRNGGRRRILRDELGSRLAERGEELFDFVRHASQPRPRLLRNLSAAPGPGEIDLTRGWRLVRPPGEILAGAAERLGEYLRSAMGAQVRFVSASDSLRAIHVQVDPSRVASPGSFRIEVSDAAVRVLGADEPGALQGLYWLRDEMEQREGPFLATGATRRDAAWRPRYLYSHLALFGDPLLDAALDSFPEAYLEELARAGIDGVWIQAVLNTLAPSRQFAEFGAGWPARLKNLNALIERTRRFGMKVYLYLNEPRAMPDAFFDRRPEMKGAPELGRSAMCTSSPAVRAWIADALAHVGREAPGLGGWFSITMSENLTNCFSHGGSWGRRAPVARGCPPCSERTSWEVIGELIRTFRDGIRQSDSAADLIVWDWGWPEELLANLIPLLPKDVRFMSVSEWEQPVDRGGVSTKVGEYSISVVGPGPRAIRNWERARRQGLTSMAKVQFDNTWEISAVPYIPVPHLVVEHCQNLTHAGVSGVMASWTCGGSASPNLAAAKQYYFEPRPSSEAVLEAVARRRYGQEAAAGVVEAWARFSEAFRQFPYGVSIYVLPTQHGPANLLRLRPTGYKPGMILFPHDDITAWCGPYPPAVVVSQLNRLVERWSAGLDAFRGALKKVPQSRRAVAELDLAIAETCRNHFQSVRNQVEFYLLRERLQKAGRGQETLAAMRAIVKREIEIARRQFCVARRHSAIAFEASNHYYYTPLDLAEKILNCRKILEELSEPGR